MPAKSEKQRKFMGAELARKREGKKTKTGMSEKKLEEYASKGKKRQLHASTTCQGKRAPRSHLRSFCRPRSRPIRKWLRSLAL